MVNAEFCTRSSYFISRTVALNIPAIVSVIKQIWVMNVKRYVAYISTSEWMTGAMSTTYGFANCDYGLLSDGERLGGDPRRFFLMLSRRGTSILPSNRSGHPSPASLFAWSRHPPQSAIQLQTRRPRRQVYSTSRLPTPRSTPVLTPGLPVSSLQNTDPPLHWL